MIFKEGMRYDGLWVLYATDELLNATSDEKL